MKQDQARAAKPWGSGAAAPVPETLAVDAGQTATRVSLHVGGARGRVGEGPGVRHLQSPGGIEQVARAIHAAAGGAGVPDGPVDVICIGLSGYVDGAPELEGLARELGHRYAGARVVIASDVVTSYLGALGLRRGVVIAAGTGSVTLGADGDGAVALVDGWGHLLGDAGSGFAIGRAGLAGALRAVDGRGGSPALRLRAEAMFGRLEGLPTAVYGSADPVGRIAAFAPAVADAARAGDAAALAIWSTAADELAAAAAAAAQRTVGDQPAVVSWAGGLFAEEALLREPFVRRLADRAPQLRVVAPLGGSLAGAPLLAAPATSRLFPGRVWASAGARA